MASAFTRALSEDVCAVGVVLGDLCALFAIFYAAKDSDEPDRRINVVDVCNHRMILF